MTTPRLPRAPWHSHTTRRLALLRVGLPTLVVCVFAAGPAMAREATMVPPQAAAIVRNVTTGAGQMFDPPHGGHRPDHTEQRPRDER